MENITENVVNEHSHIKGWGIDADPANEPTYPMKIYTGDDHRRMNYERPPMQPKSVEVLHSNERPGLTSVFGTSSPPTGLSGKIRRYAFKFSEGSWGHWLPLMLADRVNVVEGIVDDLKKGYIPNIIKERGWTAEWKYNRNKSIQRIAIGVAITSALITMLVYRKNSKTSS